MFNEALMKIYATIFGSWYTERKSSNDGRELQVDIGSAQKINSPKILISSFQTKDRTTPNKARNLSTFDTNQDIKNIVEIDGAR